MVFSRFGSIATRLPLCVCAYILGLFSVPLGVPKMSLRPLGNDRFLLCLSLDLDGVPLLFLVPVVRGFAVYMGFCFVPPTHTAKVCCSKFVAAWKGMQHAKAPAHTGTSPQRYAA